MEDGAARPKRIRTPLAQCYGPAMHPLNPSPRTVVPPPLPLAAFVAALIVTAAVAMGCAGEQTAEPDPAPDGEPAASPDGEPAATPEGEPTASPEGEPAAAPEGEPAASPEGEPDALCDGTGLYPAPVLAGPAIDCGDGLLLNGWGVREEGFEREACYYLGDIGGPPQKPLIVYLHGFSQNVSSVDDSDVLTRQNDAFGDALGYRVVVPQGLTLQTPFGNQPGWDATDIDLANNNDVRAIETLIAQVVARGEVDPERIYLVGYSNGAYLAGLFSFARPDVVAGIWQHAGESFFGEQGCEPILPTPDALVPTFISYFDCDNLVACGQTQSWIADLESLGHDETTLQSVLLSAPDGTTATTCAQTCTDAVGFNNHITFPTTVTPDALTFLSAH